MEVKAIQYVGQHRGEVTRGEPTEREAKANMGPCIPMAKRMLLL